MSAECPLTELPPEQCACRNHRGGNLPDAPTGAPFTAEYGGVCARCDGRIQPGDQIARVLDGCPSDGYVHARRCP